MPSLVDQDLRRRAERIMGGERNPEDLTRLFLDQRERFHSRQAFLEIGDFIAHRDLRTKGFVSRRARDWQSVVWNILPLQVASGYTPKEEMVEAALPSALRMLSDEFLKKLSGLRRDVAKSVLGAIQTADYGRRRRITSRESQLLEVLRGTFESRPLFSSKELIEDLKYVLVRNKVISESELDLMDSAKDFVSSFALAQMHGCEIDIPNGMPLQLLAHIHSNKLDVWCPIPFPAKHITIVLTAYQAELEALDHCSDRLIAAAAIAGPALTAPLELRGDKLDLL